MSAAILACLAFVAFSYAGYPVWLALRARWRPRPWHRQVIRPPVTVVIAAHNEERHIRTRLENLRQQEYPLERLSIVVASDGSTDRTPVLVHELAQQWRDLGVAIDLQCIALPGREGKCMALNRAMERVNTDIVVFTDARQTFEPHAIARLMENFADSGIGAASGRLRFRQGEGESAREISLGLYWRLETFVRHRQALTGSVMGVTGAIYAMRRELFRPLPANMLVDDLYTPLNVMAAGRRVVLDDRAVAWDEPTARGGDEYRRKVRTLTGVWQCAAFALGPSLPDLRLKLRFFAHKFSRLLVPWVLLLLLLLCLTSDQPGWRLFAVLQIAGYVAAAATPRVAVLRGSAVARAAHLFLLLNVAAGQSLIQALRGQHRQLWHRPVDRRQS